MILEYAKFQNYRNIRELELSFSEGVNVLLGENAQGKTNILEGIYVFAAGRSFRGAKDRELVRFGEVSGAAEIGYVDREGDKNTLSVKYSGKGPKTMRYNGMTERKVSDFVGHFHGVLFCPENLSLIQGGAAGRRAYLDQAISQLRPAYLHALVEYNGLLKQRNALLKKEGTALLQIKPLLEVLTEQMAPYHAAIVRARASYLERVREHVRDFLCDISGGGETVTMFYESLGQRLGIDGVEDKEALAGQFYEESLLSLQRDYRAGVTLVGCHRDDFDTLVNEREARLYCSQGQDRSLVLALKLAEGEIAKEKEGEYPVFLFDDVLSELDKRRQEYLLHHMKDRQVLLTACHDDGSFRTSQNVNIVKNGTVEKRSLSE